MKVAEARERIEKITALLDTLDPDLDVLAVTVHEALADYIQISGRTCGLDKIKRMAWDNGVPLLIDPCETGCHAHYNCGKIEISAIIPEK